MFFRWCISLIIAFLYLIPSPVKGEWGVKSGITFSTFSEGNTEWQSGYSFGIFKDIDLTKNLELSFELNLTQRKSILYDMIHLPCYCLLDYDISYNYYEVPILLKMPISLNDYIFWKPYVGFSIELGTGKGVETQNRRPYSGEDPIDRFENSALTFDKGINAGCFLQYHKIFADFRYFHGVIWSRGIYRHDYAWRSLNVSIGYVF